MYVYVRGPPNPPGRTRPPRLSAGPGRAPPAKTIECCNYMYVHIICYDYY